jgi:protocatechuate 3,4-dioxygenase beta subunit
LTAAGFRFAFPGADSPARVLLQALKLLSEERPAMKTLQRIASLLILALLLAVVGMAQSSSKETTASVSGRVTIGGKGAPGITVVATLNTSFLDNKTVAKTTTDEEGNYQLSGLPAGPFTIMPLAKAYKVATATGYKELGQAINIAEAEAVTRMDFALVRGGVITGRITDIDGHPVIGESVNIALNEKNGGNEHQRMMMSGGPGSQTDDRGVFRIYGLAPGTYTVSVGRSASAGEGSDGSPYVRTFFPGVQDEAKATAIEIKEGTEIANVDISVARWAGGFSAAGRVVDADSGEPVMSAYVVHAPVDESDHKMRNLNYSGNETDANGAFRLEGLQPGHYAVFTLATVQNSSYSEPALFEISDSDIKGIEIKVRRGATLDGVVFVENNSDPAALALLQSVRLTAYVESKRLGVPSYAEARVDADNSFHLSGLAPGKARIWMQAFPTPPKGLTLVRTELDGLEQPEGIEITAGAHISGVRVVFAYGTGSVRGEVKLEGGTLPAGTQLQLALRSLSDSRRLTRSLEVDSRYHFLGENIPPGNYELSVRAISPDANAVPSFEPVKQNVTIANGAQVQVTLTIDLGARRGAQ